LLVCAVSADTVIFMTTEPTMSTGQDASRPAPSKKNRRPRGGGKTGNGQRPTGDGVASRNNRRPRGADAAKAATKAQRVAAAESRRKQTEIGLKRLVDAQAAAGRVTGPLGAVIGKVDGNPEWGAAIAADAAAAGDLDLAREIHTALAALGEVDDFAPAAELGPRRLHADADRWFETIGAAKTLLASFDAATGRKAPQRRRRAA
jgi:hypothetical protein